MRFPSAGAVLLAAICLSPVMGSAAGGQGDRGKPAGQTQLSERDQEFLDKAIQSGLAEVAFGQLAEKNARNPAVKDFARRMVEAHTKLDDRLAVLARAKDFSPPQELEKEWRDLHDNWKPIKGTEFDHLYMRQQVGLHLKIITLYDLEAVKGRDLDIKGFVADTLPELQGYYALARETETKLPNTAPLLSPSGVVETRQPMGGPGPRQ